MNKTQLALIQVFLLSMLLTTALPGIGQAFKVVGYLPYYRFSQVNDIDFTQLTHLNLAFANPDSAGNLDIPGDQDMVIAMARAANPDIVISLSLAGGALTSAWAAAYQQLLQPANRTGFIHKIALYLEQHGYDGMNVDLEWSHVDANYSGFAIELADTLHARGMLMTSAWPGTYRYPDISNAALSVFDFVNMMVYDLRGPWDPGNPGHHSPYTFATQSIDYWLNQGVPAHKLTLGLPFYGYDFSDPNQTQAFTYRSMVSMDTAYAYLDQVGQRYYNGIPTIEAKTRLALQEVSGIMIWELGQDALGSNQRFSLLDAAFGQIPPAPTSVDAALSSAVTVFPNPAQEFLSIRPSNPSKAYDITVTDLSGKTFLRHEAQSARKEFTFSIEPLPPGCYLLRISTATSRHFTKFIKI